MKRKDGKPKPEQDLPKRMVDEKPKPEQELPKKIADWKQKPEQELPLMNLGLEKIPREVLELEPLTKLSLAGNSLTSLSPELLQRHKDMKSLDISNNKFSQSENSEDICSTIQGLSKLEKLVMAENSVHDPISLFRSISTLQNLTNLDMGAFDMSYQIGRCLVLLAEMTNLRSLRLSGCQIHGFPSILTTLKDLDYLCLNFNHFSVIPNEIGAFSNLTGLELEGCGISRIGEGLCELRKLTRLNLNCNELAVLPAGMEKMESLSQLYLYFNNFEEEFCGTLLKSLPALSELHLIGNLVAPEFFDPRANSGDNLCQVGKVNIICAAPEQQSLPTQIPLLGEDRDSRIYWGDYSSATNKHILDHLGIRSILAINARRTLYLSRYHYSQLEIVEGSEDKTESLFAFFQEGIEFIHRERNGVLVHCDAGVKEKSPLSAAMIIAYYIQFGRMSLESAFETLREAGKEFELSEALKYHLQRFAVAVKNNRKTNKY